MINHPIFLKAKTMQYIVATISHDFQALFPEFVDYDYFLDAAIDLTYAPAQSAVASTIRNQLKGTVKSIVSDKILSEVNVETAAGIVASVITTASLKALKLKKGDVVSVLVKATNVSLAKN